MTTNEPIITRTDFVGVATTSLNDRSSSMASSLGYTPPYTCRSATMPNSRRAT